MTSLKRLKSAATLHDLAKILGVKPSALSYVLYRISDEDKYTHFPIAKKSGGERQISAPDPRLKLIQKRLANLLAKCQFEIELKQNIKKQCTLSHGFKGGFSIMTNASNHRNRRWVFNIDLKDFFPSINFGRVYGFFRKNQHYSLHSKVATIIAKIACHKNQLPQGSPCSPIISNIIANILDIRLNELATTHGCTYSRYADDITFSTNKKVFPSRIATQVLAEDHRWEAGIGLTKRIAKAGFVVNDRKTRMQYRHSRQDATGLVVNSQINVRKEYYKLARAMCWRLITKGEAFEKVGGKTVPVDHKKLRGMLSFIYQVKCWDNNRRDITAEEEKNFCFRRVYADFLNYTSFYGIEQPTIVCEGKTDNIYIKCAISSLSARYPKLVDTNGVNKNILVKMFKFSKTTEAVQGLSGGAGQLHNLLSDYRKMIKNFCGVPKHPTILLVDNDSGPKKMFKHLTNILKKNVDGSEPFYFVYENLYVVPVPKLDGEFTAMERLFEPKLLDRKLDGKRLNLTNEKRDSEKYYSKNDFSIKIVQKEQSTINFDGFVPLLDALVDVTNDYADKIRS